MRLILECSAKLQHIMKTTSYIITASFLLVLSAVAGTISKVVPDRQKATITAQLDKGQELLVFIGEESLGWSSSQAKAAAITATVEASNEIKLDDGSLGKGFIFRTSAGTTYVAITPGGPVPFGDLEFRAGSKVDTKDGIYTFADIRKKDGTLVPVSIRVRQVQVHAK